MAPLSSTVMATGLTFFGMGATVSVMGVIVLQLILFISIVPLLGPLTWPTFILTIIVLGPI